MMKTRILCILSFCFAAGCNLPDLDKRDVCDPLIAVMIDEVITPADKLDKTIEIYDNAIKDKKCPMENMACREGICLFKCEVEGSTKNIIDNGECFLYECKDEYWSKTSAPCSQEKSCDEEGKTQEVKSGGECVKEICKNGKWEKTDEACSQEKSCEEEGIFFSSDSKGRCVKTTCSDGLKTEDTSCVNSCTKNGDELSECGECLNDDMNCESDKSYRCVNGVWSELEQCAYGCFENKCAICQNDAVRCENSVMQKCISSEWSDLEPCGFGCFNNACAKCESNASKCEDDKYWLCQNDEWVHHHDCIEGCEDNQKCAVPSIPEANSPCDENTFQNVCSGDLLYMCEDGVVRIAQCRYGCFDFGYTQECVQPEDGVIEHCQNDGTIIQLINACEANEGSITYFRCQKDMNGVMHILDIAANGVCELRLGQPYLHTCNAFGKREITKTLSCEMSKDGKTAVYTVGSVQGTEKLGDACSHLDDRSCDGDVVIRCDGTKYVAEYLNTDGTPKECAKVYQGAACETQRSINHAGCSLESSNDLPCNEENAGVPMVFGRKCMSDNRIDSFVCDLSDSGQYKVIGGYRVVGYCTNDNERNICGSDGQFVSELCTGMCEIVMGGTEFSSLTAVCQQTGI